MNTPKPKRPIIDRLYERTMQRWASNPDEAYRYALDASATFGPAIRQSLVARLPLPLAHRLRKASDIQRSKTDRVRRSVAVPCEVTVSPLQVDLLDQKASHSGQAVIEFLAGLPPEDRDRIATAPEKRAAIAMRKDSLLAGKVKVLLGCTAAELDRWNADGRLPHLYGRSLSFEKKTRCRFWHRPAVEAALNDVEV